MHRNRNNEKSKNFLFDIKRLVKELNIYKKLLFIAITISIFSAILSIVSPNQLSKLTDLIQDGIIVNQDKISDLSTSVNNNLISMDINEIMMLDIDDNEKYTFITSLSNIDKSNYKSLIELLKNSDDKIINTVFKDVTIDDVVINSSDQLLYLDTFSNINESSSVNDIYKKIDELPSSIQSVIKPKMNLEKIGRIAILLAVLYILSSLFAYITSLIMASVSNGFAKKLRNNITIKINKLPLRYFDNNQIGDTLSRITNDVDTVAQSMNQSFSTVVTSITLFFGTLIMMFITNYIMAITAIVSSLIGFILMSVILSRSQKYFNARQKELGKLNSHIEEVYSNLLVVKAYNAQESMDEKFDKLNKAVYEANQKSQFLGGLIPPLMGFIGNFGYVAVCIVGAILVSKEIITFGVIIAFITYVRLFSNSLSQFGQSLTSLQTASAASSRVFEFIDEEEMRSEDTLKEKLDPKKAKGNISFEHVKFGYDDNKTIIKNFSADVKHGQKIAIVGPTGAGKTTMVNLLMKFYDINDGDIKIDGVSIKDLKRENIHDLFTMVLQDTWLFNGTIKDNIKFNRKHISDADVRDVCKKVGLDHFINTLPNTYDYIIDDNSSISSGQKQLLTIARTMLDDAPFLILDEATSNVDTRTEELVSNAMDKLMKNRTSFIIAHRLSTIKNADLILVMKDGNIIEQGNHESLLKENGFYAKLYNSQFQS